MIVNIVAPPSNYPRGVNGSTSPAYGGGTVYHYMSAMGYDDNGARAVWVADSGFTPFGYWLGFDQLATLIPPKGYCFADVEPVAPPPPPTPSPVDAGSLAAATLSQAMGGSLPLARYEQLLPAFVDAMRAADITTVERAAMWCAQLGHESSGLRYMEEIADGSAYEGRRDLGNIHAGDGRRFKGRGPIQVTGRHNYTECSRWAHARGLVPTPTFFVDNPHELASDRYGFIGPVWYWTAARPQLNALSDAHNLDAATRAINGGLNGIADRSTRYQRCLDMGAALLPRKGFLMALSDDEQRRLYDAICGQRQSLVEGSTFAADHETYGRLTDAAAFRTELAVEKLCEAVARIESKLEGK
ncbi:hypothetical protein GS463_06265 [Rhodococcus hoagii]|nr:hypothetical protein [Prescottella equi]